MESGQPSTKHRAGPPKPCFYKNQILTRREPLKQATPRIKLHILLINLIKKDHYGWERSNLAQLTKMQPKVYIKDIKWLGESL